jgi:NADP-dependent 3-hydroxy acid dehydrogenase YdfG
MTVHPKVHELFDLDGKVAIVTGASSGLGESFARVLVSAGAMALAMLAFGYEELTVLDWFAGGVAGVAAYCLALLVTREVSRSEIASITRAIASRLS